MDEMKLIDAGKLEPINIPYYGKAVDWNTIECVDEIDPESLQVVKDLREENKKLKTELVDKSELLISASNEFDLEVEDLKQKLQKQDIEIVDREKHSIDQHAEIHYWRYQVKDLQKQLEEVKRDCAVAEKNHAECEERLAKAVSDKNTIMEMVRGICSLCQNYTENHNEGACKNCTYEYRLTKNKNTIDNWEFKRIKPDGEVKDEV